MDKSKTPQEAAPPERVQNLKPLARIERVLKGEAVDRPAYCLYPSYELELLGGDVLAQAVQVFVERTETDVVAVPACFG